MWWQIQSRQDIRTEPDTRDDLSGIDVARKVMILSRESGLKLELNFWYPCSKSSLNHWELVHLLKNICSSCHNLTVKWQGRDKRLRMYVADVLRYVGVVDAVSEEERVELRRYKKDHSFAQLSGSVG